MVSGGNTGFRDSSGHAKVESLAVLLHGCPLAGHARWRNNAARLRGRQGDTRRSGAGLRERETDRQTDRVRETDRQRETERETERDRDRGREEETERDTHTGRQTETKDRNRKRGDDDNDDDDDDEVHSFTSCPHPTRRMILTKDIHNNNPGHPTALATFVPTKIQTSHANVKSDRSLMSDCLTRDISIASRPCIHFINYCCQTGQRGS